MSETPPEGRLERLLAAFEKLPPWQGVTFHGLPAGAEPPGSAIVLRGLVATSRDPRVATENWAHPAVLAIVSRTGRDLTPLSAQASDAEVVLLPGVTLVPVPSPEGNVEGLRVQVLEEVLTQPASGPATGEALPVDLGGLHDLISSRVRSARALSPVQVGAPGKFSAALPV